MERSPPPTLAIFAVVLAGVCSLRNAGLQKETVPPRQEAVWQSSPEPEEENLAVPELTGVSEDHITRDNRLTSPLVSRPDDGTVFDQNIARRVRQAALCVLTKLPGNFERRHTGYGATVQNNDRALPGDTIDFVVTRNMGGNPFFIRDIGLDGRVNFAQMIGMDLAPFERSYVAYGHPFYRPPHGIPVEAMTWQSHFRNAIEDALKVCRSKRRRMRR